MVLEKLRKEAPQLLHDLKSSLGGHAPVEMPPKIQTINF